MSTISGTGEKNRSGPEKLSQNVQNCMKGIKHKVLLEYKFMAYNLKFLAPIYS